MNLTTSGERCNYGNREEQEGCGGGDGIARESEEQLRGLLVSCYFAENQRLAGLHFYASEVELSAETSESWFDQIVFACGYSAGDEEHIGLGSLRERHVERVGGVGRSREHDRFGAAL